MPFYDYLDQNFDRPAGSLYDSLDNVHNNSSIWEKADSTVTHATSLIIQINLVFMTAVWAALIFKVASAGKTGKNFYRSSYYILYLIGAAYIIVSSFWFTVDYYRGFKDGFWDDLDNLLNWHCDDLIPLWNLSLAMNRFGIIVLKAPWQLRPHQYLVIVLALFTYPFCTLLPSLSNFSCLFEMRGGQAIGICREMRNTSGQINTVVAIVFSLLSLGLGTITALYARMCTDYKISSVTIKKQNVLLVQSIASSLFMAMASIFSGIKHWNNDLNLHTFHFLTYLCLILFYATLYLPFYWKGAQSVKKRLLNQQSTVGTARVMNNVFFA